MNFSSVYIGLNAINDGCHLDLKSNAMNGTEVKLHFRDTKRLCEALVSADFPIKLVKDVKRCLSIHHAWELGDDWEFSFEELEKLRRAAQV